MKKRTLTILLTITGALFLGATALTINRISKIDNTKTIEVETIANKEINTYKGVDFIRCHINKIDYKFNYMEIQTFDFETITINFLDNTLDGNNPKFNFKEGDWGVILNAKELTRNGSKFYFADNDTVIQSIEEKPTTTIVTDRKAEELIEQIQPKEYNYNIEKEPTE